MSRSRRRVSAAILLSGLARQRKIEIRLARRLEVPFLAVLDAARRSLQAAENVEAFLRRVNAKVEEERGFIGQMVRQSGGESAQRGHDRALKELRRLGVPVEDRLLSEAAGDEVRRQLDDETNRRLDPLPDRLLKATEFLLSRRSLRPWAKRLARSLAKAASTYAEVRGELAANEDQGTGWWEWRSVGDDRVRRTHRDRPTGVGREIRRVGVMFSNGCRYPRDPLGEIKETAECRCHTRPVLPPTGGSASGAPPDGGGPGAPGTENLEPEDIFRQLERILRPNGVLIGEPGTSKRIRYLPGGMTEAQALFERLKTLGRRVPQGSYPGSRVEFRGVGEAGLREESKSGEPTIDVKIQHISIKEIKFGPTKSRRNRR